MQILWGAGYNRVMGCKVAMIIERADMVSGEDRRSAFELGAGKPVITTSYDGACDMFEDGRHGRLAESSTDDERIIAKRGRI